VLRILIGVLVLQNIMVIRYQTNLHLSSKKSILFRISYPSYTCRVLLLKSLSLYFQSFVWFYKKYHLPDFVHYQERQLFLNCFRAAY
jgi:hypothetical protein